MKVSYPRIVVFEKDGVTQWFTDARKAAEFWARAKEEEWIERHSKNPKYQVQSIYGRGSRIGNQLYDDARVRYRKLKRRALKIFRQKMEVNS